MIYTRPATVQDGLILAPKLRDQDKKDLVNGLGLNPVAGLVFSLETSTEATAIICPQEGVISLFGVGDSSIAPGTGAPWLLSSPSLTDNKRNAIRFLRECRDYVGRWHDRYDVLSHYSCLENEVHTKWLQYCGFTFISKTYFNNSPFGEFVRIK